MANEEVLEEGFRYFLVEARGYRKQYTSRVSARKKFSKMEKEGIEDEEPFSVKLFGKKNLTDEWVLLDEVAVKENYYK
ncbi:hypothetical protein ES705_27674 [subsurface metagenome]